MPQGFADCGRKGKMREGLSDCRWRMLDSRLANNPLAVATRYEHGALTAQETFPSQNEGSNNLD